MKILVTGATGFIGTYIVKTLHEKGEDFAVFDIKPPTELLREYVNDTNWIEGDISDARLVEQTVANYKPDVIINMASLMYWGTGQNPCGAVEVMILGLSNVLEAARKHSVRRVVIASSAAVYEGTSHQWVEGAEISPNVSLYGACKFLNEILSRQYRDNYDLEVTNLRCGTVYGPGKIDSPGVAQEIKKIESIASGETVKIESFAPSDPFSSFFVADAARAFVLAATVPGPLNLVYNVSGNPRDRYTLGDFVAMIKQLAPDSGDVIFGKADNGRNSGEELPSFDISRAEKELGFMPEYTLGQGVKEVIDYARSAQI